MNNHKGKVFNLRNYTLQPFTIDLEHKVDIVEQGVFNIFSDKRITKFNPNLQMDDQHDVLKFMSHVFIAYEKQDGYTYFLFDNEANKMIGIIQLITNKTFLYSYPTHVFIIEDHLKVNKNDIWGIEFYLNYEYWNRGIMSRFVYIITNELFEQGVGTLIAITDINNSACISLLKSCGYLMLNDFIDVSNQSMWIKSN